MVGPREPGGSASQSQAAAFRGALAAIAPADMDDPAVARRRLALLVKVAASAGDFSPKLATAVAQATDGEVRIMSDLLGRGMSIPALVSFLQGAHVIVGDDELYRRWIFPTSRKRLSSHHRTVDKALSPDYGYDGPLVRESLHGKASQGTWVQLERTKATFQLGKLPTWTDLVHIRDYIVYRVTGMNVGPWGLSAHVDTRPMVLQPPNATAGQGVDSGLAAFARRRSRMDASAEDRARWSSALTPDVPPVGPAGDLFQAAHPADPADLLPDEPYADDLGLGLFGGLPIVRVTAPLREAVRDILDAPVAALQVHPPDGDGGEAVTVPMGHRGHRVRGSLARATQARTAFMSMEEDLT